MIIALPTEDRVRSLAFYRDGMGFSAFGEPAEDGVPEPLQLRLGDDVTLMLIPTEGFGWVTGGRPTAAPGVSECLLSLPAASTEEVDERVARAEAAGAEVVMRPSTQPWGHYTAVVADPDGHLWQFSRS
jgi:predicted lactoylglutathione lyase